MEGITFDAKKKKAILDELEGNFYQLKTWPLNEQIKMFYDERLPGFEKDAAKIEAWISSEMSESSCMEILEQSLKNNTLGPAKIMAVGIIDRQLYDIEVWIEYLDKLQKKYPSASRFSTMAERYHNLRTYLTTLKQKVEEYGSHSRNQTMEQGFINILQKLVAEQGKQAILDASKCKAFMSDYASGDYKKESRLLLQAIDIGAAQAIDTAGDLASCKQKLADRLNEEHFIALDIAADIVNVLAFVLRGDTSRNEANNSQGTLTDKEKEQLQERIPELKKARERISKYQNCISDEFGLTTDGTVVAVGDNEYGECNVSNWRDIVAISAFFHTTVGLKSDGTVVAVGDNEYGECNVSNWRDIVAISGKIGHTVGLKSDGTVVAVGDNEYGECNVSNWRDIVAISAGLCTTLGLKSDGTVVAVGDNEQGQCNVSGWRDIVAISAGDGYTVGLKSDGTVVAVGHNESGECNVSNWRDIVAISAGFHTVGLKSDGTVVTVRYNVYSEYNIEQKRREEQEKKLQQKRREQGLCLYCGGKLTGLFKKKCKACGKES